MRALILVPLSAFLLSGCDTLAWGYVNKLDHPITVVEHGWDAPRPLTLAPKQVVSPGFGHLPDSIDLLMPDGHVFAHYHRHEISRVGSRDGFEYVVITSTRVFLQSEHRPLPSTRHGTQ